MMPISSWGRLSADLHRAVGFSDRATVGAVIAGTQPGLPRGMGRSYGDVCLNPGGVVWMTPTLDRLISFDRAQGVLVCEAGVLLRDIQRIAMASGWALPVTPGTQMVTVGGAIANDVHGKNHHHHGTFGACVSAITLVRTSGETLVCSAMDNDDLFCATIGGMGLTGFITQAALQLVRVPGPWLETESLPFDNLDAFFALSDSSEQDWEHTVAWVDCVSGARGRGIFMRARTIDSGNRKAPAMRAKRMPVTPPLSLVNAASLRAFNFAYFHKQRYFSGRSVQHYLPFSYPLDGIHDWNRMYGPKGFYQYQSVVPRAAGVAATQEMLAAIAASGNGSFLAVLKTFGLRTARGLMSFPMQGVTLALDFPNRGDATLRLFERLDAIVAAACGRLYPAKDARMPRALFEAGYPALSEFLKHRDPGISSAMSRRLMGA